MKETDTMENITESLKKQFTRYKGLAERAMEQLNDGQFFWQHNEETNSVAILVKHISGNMNSRFTDFFISDGEKPWRNRDDEFDVGRRSRKELMESWKKSWDQLLGILNNMDDADLTKEVQIRKQPVLVAEALAAALAHYSDHIGQIIFMAKLQKNSDWKTLSIPKKKQ